MGCFGGVFVLFRALLGFTWVFVLRHEDIVPTNELSIVLRQRRKWLNIVLDVNGVLGQCIPKFELGRVRRVHEMRDNIFSHETPTIVGGKAVYAWQNLREFLRQ